MRYIFTLVFCLTSMLALAQGAGIRIVDSIPVDTPVINNYQSLKVFNSADHHFYSWEDSTWVREGSVQDSIKVGTLFEVDINGISLNTNTNLADSDTFNLIDDTGTDWLISNQNGALEIQSTDDLTNFVVKNAAGTNRFDIDMDGGFALYGNIGPAAIVADANGGVSFRNYVTYFPQSRTITAGTGLNFINDALLRVTGSGGPVDITADPQIVAGQDGQILVIVGDSDTNTVTFDDGTGLALDGGVSAVLGNNDVLQLAYDSGDSVWYEISRTNN